MNEFDENQQNSKHHETSAGYPKINPENTEHSPKSDLHENRYDQMPYGHRENADEGNGYTFIKNSNSTAQGYTTPEGAHGYVYSPPSAPSGNGVGRNLIITTCVIGCLILMMGFCFLGAWAVAREADKGRGNEVSGDAVGGNGETPGTAEGFVIVEGTEEERESKEENGIFFNPEISETTVSRSESGDKIPPENATFHKKEPQRIDADGDGKADTQYDQNGQVLTSAGNSTMTLPTVISKVAASVVEISTETLVQSNWIGQYVTGGAGSGVIIAEEGYIITNHHVIDGADSITVRLNDGAEFAATLVGSDEQTDVAILWIDPGEYQLTVATMGASFDLVAGEDVIAIGNPLGSLGGTVTEGIISATERQISVDGNAMTLLQVSAPINPGNSGGGLFNMAGELVGIVNAKMSSKEIEGLGFAIPSDTAYEIACELMKYRYVRGRVTTGLTLVDVESLQTAMYYFNSRYTGVYVYESVSDVLQYGDRILSVNGTELKQSKNLSELLRGAKVGDTVIFEIYRNKQQMTVELVLMEQIPDYLTPNTPSLAPAA